MLLSTKRSDQGDKNMRFKSLVVVFAALFLVAACESTTSEKGDASGKGAMAVKKSGKDFSIKPGSSQDLIVNVGDRVFFGFDKSSLTADSRATLEKQAAWMKKYPSVGVSLEGHADERGTREYNLALGDRRANSAKDYLVALGISPNRVKTISYGKERPVALGHEESSWSQNRRAVMVVSGAGS
jgi:peptidoglycan-associated lipoprotein